MSASNIQIIAKEGWVGAGILAVLFLLCFNFDIHPWGWICLIMLCLWVYVFRNPERITHARKSDVYAPVDGIVRDIHEEGARVCVVVQTRIQDVGVIRAPSDIGASVFSQKSGLSLFFAKRDKKHALNASFGIKWEDIEMRFFPELFTTSKLHTRSNLAAGERCGYMKLGYTRLYLPKHASIRLTIGDVINAGNTIVGSLDR